MAGIGQRVTREDRSVAIPVNKQIVNAMALVCQRGPIGKAVLIRDWTEFQKVFGGFIDGEPGTYCARTALNAGSWLWVTRIVHLADVTDLTTKTSLAATALAPDRGTAASHGRSTGSAGFPVRLEPGQTLVASVNGAGDQTLTFTATPAQVQNAAGTYAAVTAGHQLVAVVNGVRRTATFDGTEASAVAFYEAIAAQLIGCRIEIGGVTLRIRTDLMGTGASITIDPSTSPDVLASLGFTSGQTATGTGNVANIDAVTGTEFQTLATAAFPTATAGIDLAGHPYLESNTTGTASTVQVKVASTAVGLGFDTTVHAGSAAAAGTAGTFTLATDGTWSHTWRIVVSDDPTDPANRLRVQVLDAAGRTVLDEPGLSIIPTDPANRYITNVLAQTDWIRYTHTGGGTTAIYRPAAGTYTPAGGSDGLAGLVDADYLGDATARTGLHALDLVRGFRCVAAPGRTALSMHAAGAAYGLGATQGLVRWVGSVPLALQSKNDVLDYRQRTGAFTGGAPLDDAGIALYAGWHEVAAEGPSRGVIWIPADGEVFAAIARSVAAGGPWFAPAGSSRAKLSDSVRRLRIELAKPDAEALLQQGVNCACDDPSYGFILEGNHTLLRAPSVFQSFSVSMLFDVVGEEVSIAIAPLRYEPNDAVLFRNTRNLITAYLEKLKSPKLRAIKDFRVTVTGATSVETRNQTDDVIEILPIDASEWQNVRLVAVAPGTSLAA